MKKLIIGNWKLNPLTLKAAQRLAGQIDRCSKNTAVICPPIAFLGQIDYPNVGAQDCFWQNTGAYTGQVSPAQLKNLGVKYCIVGHSERRKIGETNQQARAKLELLLASGIIPVLCVGYGTTIKQDEWEGADVIKQQLSDTLDGLDAKKVVVAYEPVWAISSGNPYATKTIASPDHAEKIAIFIHSKYSVAKVLYGGSANSVNAPGFLRQRNVGGLLVGGASLLPEDFNAMINT